MVPYEGQTTTLAGNGTFGNTTRSNDDGNELLSSFMLALPHAILVTVMLAFLSLSFILYKRRKAKHYRHLDRIKSYHESVVPHSAASWSSTLSHERRLHHHRKKKAKRLHMVRGYFHRHAHSTTPVDHHDNRVTSRSVRRQAREEHERTRSKFWWWRRGNVQTKLHMRRGEEGEDSSSNLELRAASRTPSRADVFLP